MMGFMALIIVAAGASFACVYLLTYVPLITKNPITRNYFSPRLFIVNKLLAPMDAGVTLILVAGVWVGLTSALGISAMVYNVLSGIGLSVGVMITKKFFAPRWTQSYHKKLIELQASNTNNI